MARTEKSDSKTAAERKGAARSAGKSRRWVVLLVVSVWMFVLGVLVGRGTAPVHFDIEALQTELSELRQAVLDKEKSRFRIFDDEAERKGKELGFYKNLKKSAPEEKTAPPVKKSPKPPPPAAERPSAKPKTESAEAKTEPAPGLGAETVSAGEKPYTIQVASLKEERSAAAMVDRLQVNGYPAYRERADIEGKGTWHRVRIGSFADAADAARTLERLKAAELKPLLIRK